MSGWRRFLGLWAAQTASMTCGGLTVFALGIWICERTGSATDFALLSVATMLPSVLALPLAGTLVDRWGPRRSLVAADLGGAVRGVVLALLFLAGVLAGWKLLAVLAAGALVTALHWPAYTSATTGLVDDARLPRAAAMMNLGYVGYQVLAPAIGAVLLVSIGLAGVLAIDVGSYVVAVLAILVLGVRRSVERPATPTGTVWHELRIALLDVKRRGLLRLSVYVALTYLPGGLVVALSTPLVLTFATPVMAGLVTSVFGLGMFAGGGVSTWLAKSTNGMRRLVRFDFAMAVGMLMIGLGASTLLISVAGFVFLFGLTGHMSEEQALWQTRVPAELQGRAFALRRMITWSLLPVSYALAGPLADRVFEPLMAAGGALAPTVGAVIGSGHGRGMALLLICGGSLKLVVAKLAARDELLARLDRAPIGRVAG
jgi:MFS family permease